MKNLNEQIIEELIFENIDKLDDEKIIEEIDKIITDIINIETYCEFQAFLEWNEFKKIYSNFKDWKILCNNKDELQWYDEQFSENIANIILDIIEKSDYTFIN